MPLDFYNQWWHSGEGLLFTAVYGLFGEPNSQCASGSVSDLWLVDHCKRISEVRAREVHPALFDYLDSDK